MLDITVIILTYNEKLHIERCIENVSQFAKKIYVVDCFSTDGTQKIARSLGAEVIEHKWPGNQAEQFNWALDNLPIDTKWILRIDADEYLLPELVDELKNKLPNMSDDVTGIVLKRRHIFMDKWMRRGIYPVKLLRIFRNGHGRCEQRLMDEHIELADGKTIELDYDFCDHNLNNLSWFCQKHINYAVREAAELLDIEFNLSGKSETNTKIAEQAKSKRIKKEKYAKQPLFLRSTAYFIYRYLAKGAVLDGKVGFIWTFMQGWWYRTLVDAKIYELKRKSGGDPEKIKQILKSEYNISI